MKKFIGLAFCLAMVIGMSACDDEGVTVDNDDSFSELVSLSGTTWVKVENAQSLIVVQTETASNGGITVTELPMAEITTTITFNADGTFTANFAERYTAYWDAEYVDGANTTYAPNHTSSTADPFNGYEGNYVDTNSVADANVTYTGLWKRVEREDGLSNEESYTFDYSIKVLTRVLNSYDIDDTDTAYSLADTIVDTYTYMDEDVDWTDLGTITNISVGGQTAGFEVDFDFTNGAFTFDTYFTDGIYTQQ